MSIRLSVSSNTGALYQLCILALYTSPLCMPLQCHAPYSPFSSISYANSERLWLNSHAASCAVSASSRHLCAVSYVVSSMVSLVCVVLRDVAV